MYRFLSRPKKRRSNWTSWGAVATGCFAVVHIFNSRVEKFNEPLVFERGVSVSAMRASPPFAVLEDELLDIERAQEVPFADGAQFPLVLNSKSENSQPIQLALAFAKAKLEKEEIAVVPSKQMTKSTQVFRSASDVPPGVDVVVSGRTIRTMTDEERAALGDRNIVDIAARFNSSATSGASETGETTPDANHEITINLNEIGVTQEEMARAFAAPFVVAAQEFEKTRDQFGNDNDAVRAIASNAPSAPKPVIPQPKPGHVRFGNGVVHLADNEYTPVPQHASSRSPAASPLGGSQSFVGEVPGSGSTARVDAASAVDSQKGFVDGNSERPMLVQGQIEFSGGLALTGTQDTLTVFREVSGVKIEQGQVWLREGRYEIYLQALRGNLLAELRDSDSQLIGKATLPLRVLTQIPSKEFKAAGILLRLEPVRLGLTGVANDLLSGGSVADVNISPLGSATESTSNEHGEFTDKALGLHSQMYVRTRSPDYWPTLSFVQPGSLSSAQVDVVSQEAIQSLAALATKSISGSSAVRQILSRGIVMGRLMAAGHPSAGLQVRFIEPELSQMKPVYFNDRMQPDISLQETSANGMYVFLGVPSGIRSMRVLQTESVSDITTYYVEKESLTRVDADVYRKSKLRLQSFDAFNTSRPISVDLRNIDGSETTRTDNKGRIEFPVSRGSAWLTVRSVENASYVSSQTDVSRDQKNAYLPLIARDWLALTLAKARLSRGEKLGMIVGFVQSSEPYRVYLDAERTVDNVDSQLVYFNSRGEILTGQSYGVPGGGYMIVNAALGLQTITVAPLRTEKIYIQTTHASSEAISVVHHLVGD